MTFSNEVVRLRAAARSLLSALFQAAVPTSGLESLELELFNMQTYLGRLDAVALDDSQQLLDWGDLLDDLQICFDEVQDVIDRVGDDWLRHPSTSQRMDQLVRKLPVCTLFLVASLATLGYVMLRYTNIRLSSSVPC
jgi:hypothetical protein